ncbi:odorant receptor 94b-like [Teleopsis dalmanni]|uniref:odorant receptor 94b-like n=1 Tax=Teleopsis dalmanni TaxID=139649 RepID=UPI0018CD7A36|nr:odorant receptor 94b-like [Teleopsis dalmanni]
MTTVDNISSARTLITILKVTGFWHWHKPEEKSGSITTLELCYRFIVHLPLTFVFISLMWTEVLTSKSLEEAGNVMYITMTETGLLCKIFNIWLMGKEAWSFIDELKKNKQLQMRTDSECKLWLEEHRKFKRVAFSYIIGSLVVAYIAFISVLFLSKYELAYGYYVPFEWKNPTKYWYAYFFDMIAMSLNCLSNITLDMTYCYFMFHIGALYKLISFRLAALEQMKEVDVIRELKSIFRLHKHTKRLTLECQRLVSAPVLAQIMLSALTLCFSGYRLIHVSISIRIKIFINMFNFLGVMAFQIFLFCYYANEITINANHLTWSAYNTNWLHYSKSTKNLVFIYMEFLKQPVTIKVANLFDVGLPIFSRTMNNAYSLFAVLIKMSN